MCMFFSMTAWCPKLRVTFDLQAPRRRRAGSGAPPAKDRHGASPAKGQVDNRGNPPTKGRRGASPANRGDPPAKCRRGASPAKGQVNNRGDPPANVRHGASPAKGQVGHHGDPPANGRAPRPHSDEEHVVQHLRQAHPPPRDSKRSARCGIAAEGCCNLCSAQCGIGVDRMMLLQPVLCTVWQRCLCDGVAAVVMGWCCGSL